MRRRAASIGGLCVAIWAAGSVVGCGGKAVLDGTSSASGGSSSDAGTRSNDAGSATCGDTLSDSQNCGACGAVCSGQCGMGRCSVTLASAQANVGCVAVDAQTVYWINAGDALDEGTGELRETPITGGAVTTLVTRPGSDLSWPCQIRLHDSKVYWTSGDGGGPVFSVAKTGGTPLEYAPPDGGGIALAVDDASVYWVNRYTGVYKAALDGSNEHQVSTEAGTMIAIDGAHIYWTFSGDPDPTAGKILSLPLSGAGMPSSVVTGLDDPWAIAADASGIYWQDYGDGNVTHATADGSANTLATNQFAGTTIAIDESSVYFAAAGKLSKVPKAGGAPVVLAYVPNVFDIAVDDTSVYWTTGEEVMKLTPK